jgi:RNA polymerase sigma factor (sigma-70 family)
MQDLDPSVADDRDLLELLLQPQTAEQGFRRLVERYQVRLYGHIRRLVGRHEDADDVLQNTFVKAYHGIGRFRGESRLYTWLFRIATNEALNFLQREQRRQTAPFGDLERTALSARADPAMPCGQELRDLLDQAVAELPHKQRIVFDLRYFEEMPYGEMSKVLDTSEGALKASYHHAVKKIEEYVRVHGENLLNH